MARIRSVKPELRTDATVGSWPRDARYAWVLLWGYLDDAGRGRDDIRLLNADLFPLDRDVTDRKLDGWLTLMTRPGPGDPEGPLCRYEVTGIRYLHAVNWRHQRINRPTPSRLPACPIHDNSVSRSRALHDRLTEGSPLTRVPEEQGAGSREQGEEQGAGSGVAPIGASTATADEDPAKTAMAGQARRIVDATVNGQATEPEKRKLAEHVLQAFADGATQEHAISALREWTTRDKPQPGLLPSLLGDAMRGGRRATAVAAAVCRHCMRQVGPPSDKIRASVVANSPDDERELAKTSMWWAGSDPVCDTAPERRHEPGEPETAGG